MASAAASIFLKVFSLLEQAKIHNVNNRNGIKVKNFSKVGSLKLANFFHHIEKNKIPLKKSLYDVCLISDAMLAGRNDDWNIPTLEEGFARTMKYTVKFCMKHNMKMVFSWKRDKKIVPKGFSEELV